MELGEGEGDLMKMLMQNDPPEETIQRPMEDPAMVQSGGYPQTGIGYGSAHYSGMQQQQQLPGMGHHHHQQPRGSSYHSISPGQMIPRSPNNGMMHQDLDLVLQQQQYQQQHQQTTYGSGNFQGYNGGYGGPRPMSPQTSAQSMGPYQGGFPSEPGYPQGPGTNHTVGEFGPQAGSNQSMGMPGPASLSLANLSARQQYYSDGYGMNTPVSPVHKQMQQSGGFLQPSGMPYSQQVQSYQSSSYPKRPSPSSVPSQMQGFNAGGSFTARSNVGLQMPSMPYQSPTSPYQPPHSPVMRPTTSPVQQQDVGLYSRPREAFPQPRSPFGSSQGQFQQQQQQQQHSSCMFLQPSTTPSQSQYQSHQQKVGGLTQRRASYPGQQSTMKMPSPPPKRSPPSPLPNPKSPDLLRGNQLGFDDRGSLKPVAKKEKSSSPPYLDASHVVAASQMKGTLLKKGSDGQKGLPRLRRSASDVGSPSVSPPLSKIVDASKSEEEGCDIKVNEDKKAEEAETLRGTRQSERASHSPKKQPGDRREENFQTPEENKCSGSWSNLSPEQNESAVKTLKPENIAQAPKDLKLQGGCKEGEDGKSDAEKSSINPDAKKTKVPTVESLDLVKKDGISKEVICKTGENPTESKALCSTENLTSQKDDLTIETERTPANDNGHAVSAEKSGEKSEESGKASDDRDRSSSEMTNSEDQLSKKPVLETGKPANEKDNRSREVLLDNRRTSIPVNGSEDHPVQTGKKVGQSDSAPVEGNPETSHSITENRNGDASESKETKEADETDTVPTDMKGTVEQRFEPVKSANVGTPASNKCEPSSIEPNKAAEANLHSEKPKSESTSTVAVQRKAASVSLRCEERLSSDDDERLLASKEDSSPPPVQSRTQGIQTTEQTTASPRSSHQQVTPIKATIIAKGKSAQSNQQVMVAKTTTGQMYLIQGNILVPVQSLSSDSLSKQNSKVIIVNPVKSAAGQVKHIQTETTVKIADTKEHKSQAASKVTAQKDKASEAGKSSAVHEISDEKLKSDRLPSSKGDTKTAAAKESDKHHTATLGKEKVSNNSGSVAGRDLTNSADKKSDTPSTSKQVESTEDKNKPAAKTPGRGRPPGSKDKQKRKSFVHKSKRTEDERKVDEPASKRKFTKTATVVKEMSSTEASTSSKRPLSLEVPTVNASKSPKRRKVSTSGTPVKHISVKPRGGVDGDSWVCSLCGKRSGCNLLGDLYGPYKTKYSKEKTDSSSAKDGKLSQKLNSPGRKSTSSSDTHLERKSSSNEDDMEICDLDLWIHRDCGVWSPGVFMLGKTLHGLEQAVESAAQHKCVKCSEVGATLVCFKRGCNKMYHYACARDSGCTFVEDNFTIFCSTHK